MAESPGPNPYAAPNATTWEPPPLQPTGSVLFQAASMVANHAGVIATVVGAIWGPTELVSSYLEFEVFPTDFAICFWITMGLETIAYPLSAAAVIAIATSAVRGEPVSLVAAFATSIRSFWRLAFTYVLYTLLIILGLVLLVLPGVYLAVRLALIDVVVVMEGRWGPAAIGRSFVLTSNYFWKLFALGLVLALLTMTPWFLHAAAGSLMPLETSWLIDAAIDFSTDLIGAYGTVCFFLVYQLLSSRAQF